MLYLTSSTLVGVLAGTWERVAGFLPIMFVLDACFESGEIHRTGLRGLFTGVGGILSAGTTVDVRYYEC